MSDKGYSISTYWCDADYGYRYSIYDSKGKVVLQSKDAFWYEENAIKAAEQEIEKM